MTGRQMAWATPGEALGLVFLRTTLLRTVRIALVVGTILSLVNQGADIIGGHASTGTWLRVAANYVVPFCVSSVGFLSAPGWRGSRWPWWNRRSLRRAP